MKQRIETAHYSKEILISFIGFTSWSFSDALIRSLNAYPTVLIACVSTSISTILLCLFSQKLGGFYDTFSKPQLKLRILRGAIIACCTIFAYITFSNLDLATAYALIFIAPFLSSIISVILNRESVTAQSWLVIFTGFTGMLIILRPGLIPLSIGTISALLSATFFSLGFVLTRYIKKENQTFLSMAFFQYIIVSLLTVIPAYQAYNALDPSLIFGVQQFFITLGVSLTALIGALMISTAYSRAPTALVAPIHYVQILWGTLLGAIFFTEYPDFWTIVGGSIIVAGGLMLIGFNKKKKRSQD